MVFLSVAPGFQVFRNRVLTASAAFTVPGKDEENSIRLAFRFHMICPAFQAAGAE
jgi:hypothetical protein